VVGKAHIPDAAPARRPRDFEIDGIKTLESEYRFSSLIDCLEAEKSLSPIC
jgi:hypothetical protein